MSESRKEQINEMISYGHKTPTTKEEFEQSKISLSDYQYS
jgi:hypothetical protein